MSRSVGKQYKTNTVMSVCVVYSKASQDSKQMCADGILQMGNKRRYSANRAIINMSLFPFVFVQIGILTSNIVHSQIAFMIEELEQNKK